MFIALEYGQAKQVWPDSSHQHVVAVVQQMVRCDRRGDIVARCLNKLHGVGGGDVFKHDTERREGIDDRDECVIDKGLFAIKNIHVMIGDFTVYQQWQIMPLHRLENVIQRLDARDARIRVGGCAGRVKFDALHMRRLGRLRHHLRGGGVSEIQDHERVEVPAFWDMSQNAFSITECICHIQDRWCEVGHDDATPSPTGHVGHRGGEGCPVPQVDVPVIR